MEIIDLKKHSMNKLVPVCLFKKVLLLREMVNVYYPFDESGIKNYYLYNIESKNIDKIDIGKMKILTDLFHQKQIEGEDAFYCITYKKQLLENEYYINKIDIETGKVKVLFEFNMDKTFDTLSFEVMDNENILVFFKKEHKLSYEEFENFDLSKCEYGYEKAILYNIISGEQFEVKDKNLLRGFRFEFFKVTLKNEECIVFEENYLEPYDKEQIYLDIHMQTKSKEEKFFYRDCLKYVPLEKFISEVKEGKEKISFIDIESRGIEGYELFSGIDDKNIYYEINEFGVENAEAIVIMDRENLSKKTIILPNQIEEDSKLISKQYTWNLENKYKVIFYQKLTKNRDITVKEVMGSNICYTYPENLGFTNECLEERYLITFSNRDGILTSVIDMENDGIHNFKREHAVFEDYLFLY